MSSHRPTLEHMPVLNVVVIGGPDELVEATRRAASLVTNATLVTAEVATAATNVARARPFAVVMSDELYGFDSREFDALARDVQARLIVLPTDGVSERLLQQRLTPLVMDAFREYFREY
jgi:hypothetical protein